MGVAGTSIAGSAGIGYGIQRAMKKPSIETSPSEKASAVFGGIKDDIHNRIQQSPGSIAALGVAALGAGYGTYRYLKNRKNKGIENT